MKFLHLSDLHLGRRLCEVDLYEDQRHILNQCLAMAKEHQVDGVLVAGDVYDRSVPTVGAVALLDEFLTGLCRAKIPVYLISGNHDSADRLGFGSQLLKAGGVHLAAVFSGGLEHYVLEDAFGPVHLWALPFIRPSQVRAALPEETIESYTDAVAALIRAAGPDFSARNLIMAHQFVTSGGRSPETCDSETLNLGTLDNVDAAVFEGFDYVALGHIHGPQQVGAEHIRYCSSPLAYSVSEVRHRKAAVLVELGEKGGVRWQPLPFAPLRPLRRVQGPLEELIDSAEPGCADFVHAVLTDRQIPPNAAARMRSVYPNLVKLELAPQIPTGHSEAQLRARQLQRAGLLDQFADFYQTVHGQPLSEEERAVLEPICREVEA